MCISCKVPYQQDIPYYSQHLNMMMSLHCIILYLIEIFTYCGWEKMAAISQTTVSNAFCWIKLYEFRFNFHWSLLIKGQLTIFQHWFRKCLGSDQVPNHYMSQRWHSLLMHTCVTCLIGLRTKFQTLNFSCIIWIGRIFLCNISITIITTYIIL